MQVYINKLDQHVFIYHFWCTFNFESTNKKPPFIKIAFLFLVSKYYGCKEETIKLIPYYMTHIIYKTVKLSHLKKLQIIQNINNLMFQSSSYFLTEFW